MLQRWCAVSWALVVLPAVVIAAPAQPRLRRQVRHEVQSAASAAHQDDDDYAHIFYEVSPARGFHVFVRTASGAQREVTAEPDWEARHKAAIERLHNTRRSDYVRSHPALDATVRNAILTGSLVPAMTTDQVRACAGDPVQEQRSLSREGLLEEWRYGITLPEATGELPLLDGQEPCGEGTVVRKGQACVLHFIDGVLRTWERQANQAP